MGSFFRRFVVRTLRVEILTIFLALLTFSSIVVVTFTYVKDTKAFDVVFHRTMHRLTGLIIDRTICLLAEFRRIPQFIRGFLQQQPHLQISSKELIDYFLNMLSQQSDLTTLFIGMPNGDALVIDNLSTTNHPTFFSSKELAPPGTVFTYLLLDHSKPVGERETWNYVSKDLKVIAVETKPIDFDPRTRPWYTGAVAAGELYWTDVYTYAIDNVIGLSCSVPIYDSAGNLLSVVGTDMPLPFLSQFISMQTIGREGVAYICDGKGKIIIPPPKDPAEESLVSNAFAHRLPNQDDSEFYINFEGEKYLVSIHDFPLSSTKNWNVVLLDPRDDLFRDVLDTRRQIILISLAILLLSSICVVYFSKRISRPIVQLSKEVDRITHLDLESDLRVESIIQEVKMMDESIAAMRSALRSFSHYVPKDVALELIQKGQEISLGGEKKEITIFFSDIEEFTAAAETLSVEKLTSLLEEYFGVLSRTILSQDGTIDKYIGDGIMAFWGAPHLVPEHADRACLAALRCQKHLEALNQKRMQDHLPPFFTRIGINTGLAFVGNLGTGERMNYTAVGDSVNLASRLQNTNKLYHTKILISEETYAKLTRPFILRPLDVVEVKGKKQKTKIYELLGAPDGDMAATPEQVELARLFTDAYSLLEKQNLPAAKQAFEAVLAKFPDDEPTKIHLQRLRS